MHKDKTTAFGYLLPLLISISAAIGMMIGYTLNTIEENDFVVIDSQNDQRHYALGRVEEVLRFIENKYVDTITSDKLLEVAMTAIFDSLDPHSLYISPLHIQEVNDDMAGTFVGIGIESFQFEDTVIVAHVMPDSPASMYGIKKYDKLLAIDGENVAGMQKEFDDIRKLLKTAPNKTLQVTLLRGTEKTTIQITPSEIDSPSVYSRRINNGPVYIRIEQFVSDTYREFMNAIEQHIVPEQPADLILDLRGNPGGYLPEATNMLCQLFTERDKMLVYTKGKNGKINEYKTNGKQFFNIGKIAVIVDEHSASASEIVAGAVQDWDRGIIIGRRTYGKGLVQEQYALSNGGAIRLTVAEYYTPSGRSIQRDYKDRHLYHQDYLDRYDHGDYFYKDSILTKDTTPYYSLIEGRTLYGGGGIIPDIFIPKSKTDDAYCGVCYSALLSEGAFLYGAKYPNKVPTNAPQLSKWTIDPSFEEIMLSVFQNQYPDIDFQPEVLDHLIEEIRLFIGKWHLTENEFNAYEITHDRFIVSALEQLNLMNVQ